MRQIRKSVGLALLMTILFTIQAIAGTQSGFVIDEAGLLYDAQIEEMTERAARIGDTYGCGVYILTVDDFTAYGSSDINAFAQDFFVANDMGLGDTQNGIMLVLSISDRDYCLLAHGDLGNAAFTDYGKDVLAEEFLDEFGDNDWSDGFQDYLDACGEFLEQAAKGEPIDVRNDYDKPLGFVDWLISIGVGCIVSLIVCAIFAGQMNTAVKQTNAKEYVKKDSVRILEKADVYTHSTQSRRRIEKEESSGGGGTTTNSEGFSSKSGKF